MWEYSAEWIAKTRPLWNRARWRRLGEEILLVAAFVLTSSWLVRP